MLFLMILNRRRKWKKNQGKNRSSSKMVECDFVSFYIFIHFLFSIFCILYSADVYKILFLTKFKLEKFCLIDGFDIHQMKKNLHVSKECLRSFKSSCQYKIILFLAIAFFRDKRQYKEKNLYFYVYPQEMFYPPLLHD